MRDALRRDGAGLHTHERQQLCSWQASWETKEEQKWAQRGRQTKSSVSEAMFMSLHVAMRTRAGRPPAPGWCQGWQGRL